MSPEEYEAALVMIRQQVKNDLVAIAKGECPHCASVNVSITVDARQDGQSLVVGVWHNVRCPDCALVLDICVPDAPS
jgi:hypothetical protein